MAFFLYSASGFALDSLPSADLSGTPWNISADELEAENLGKVYLAKGNVTIKKGGITLSADRARLDQETMTAWASGNVVLTSGNDVLTGSRLELNFKNETGTLFEGKVFISENHFYVAADSIRKTGEQTYSARNVVITSCDGETPDWKITGNSVDVTIEGYGYVHHAALWAKTVPVMYTPFLFFPVKSKRQTGLLPPELGYSDRKGAHIRQPFYVVLNDSSDATIYGDVMEKRGIKTGLEYRYALDGHSKGAIMFDFLDDRKTDDGSSDAAESWGYEDDGISRTNHDRYWLRMKHDQELPEGFFARLDIDVVSDQDYLHEFKVGYTGFDETRNCFSDTFGREPDDYNDATRTNSLALSRNGSGHVLNTGVKWYDNVVERRWSETQTAVQKLPFFELDFIKQPILGKTPLYFQFDSAYTNFHSQDGDKGQRLDLFPVFSAPFRFRQFLAVEPSVGIRETVVSLNDDETDAGGESGKKASLSQSYYFKLDFSTSAHRTFEFGTGRVTHEILPEIVYEYVGDGDAGVVSRFDSADRMTGGNLLTCALTNRFGIAHRNGNSGTEKTSLPDGFCRIKLAQTYDIGEERETDPTQWADGEQKQPFLPLYCELQIAPGQWFSAGADAQWSHNEGAFLSRNVRLDFWDGRGDKLFAEYRNTRDSNESVYTDLTMKISDRFAVHADYERNIRTDKRIGSGFGFLYTSQCWSADIGAEDDDGGWEFSLMITLHGLGGIGG